MTAFLEVRPSSENYLRSIILFGRNVASYKFALGKSLLELSQKNKEVISLEELAKPFFRGLPARPSKSGHQSRMEHVPWGLES